MRMACFLLLLSKEVLNTYTTMKPQLSIRLSVISFLLFGCFLFTKAYAEGVFTYPSIPYAQAERFGAPVVADKVLLRECAASADSGVVVRKVAYQRAYTAEQPTTESHYVLPQHAV